MPISPPERRDSLKALFNYSIDSYCKLIDAALLNACSEEVWYSMSGVPAYVVSQIIPIYEAVGWHVRVVYDFRDGDALVFKERK